MKRFFAASVALAVAVVACNDMGTEPIAHSPDALADPNIASTTSITWEGHGSDNLNDEGICPGGYHWVLAAHGGGTEVPHIFFSEDDQGSPMFRPSGNDDPATNASWHYNSGSVDLVEGEFPYVSYPGADLSRAVLTISNCLDPQTERRLNLSKTAETSYDREHEWAIAKSVEADDELDDGTPKIWLYTDGSGDETATWNVDVTYLGAKDTNILVTGEITASVPLGDYYPALVEGVFDGIGGPTGMRVAVVCPEEFPVLLQPGDELVCTYSTSLGTTNNTINEAWVTGTFTDGDNTPLPDDRAEADVIFGDPDDELFAKIDIEDLSSHLGFQALGSLDAADLDVGEKTSFDYKHLFEYGNEGFGQDQCGNGVRVTNTATIVQTEQTADAELAVNIQCIEWESAWAKGSGSGVTAEAFCDNGFSNWGWTNQIGEGYAGSWTLHAGAGQCDTGRGTEVGHFNVEYVNGELVYSFVANAGVIFDDGAVYADDGMFPTLRNGRDTTAPGQYYVADDLDGLIWVIAHINAGIPDPDFGSGN